MLIVMIYKVAYFLLIGPHDRMNGFTEKSEKFVVCSMQ